jgi:flagellar basal-body rod protein FlgB
MVMIDPLGTRIERYMDLLSARQKLVASNLANLDTPGYRTRDVDFQFELLSAAADAPLNVIEPGGLVTKNDGNNVSLERETRMLAETALRFQFAASLMSRKLNAVRKAIEEGKGI